MRQIRNTLLVVSLLWVTLMLPPEQLNRPSRGKSSRRGSGRSFSGREDNEAGSDSSTNHSPSFYDPFGVLFEPHKPEMVMFEQHPSRRMWSDSYLRIFPTGPEWFWREEQLRKNYGRDAMYRWNEHQLRKENGYRNLPDGFTIRWALTPADEQYPHVN